MNRKIRLAPAIVAMASLSILGVWYFRSLPPSAKSPLRPGPPESETQTKSRIPSQLSDSLSSWLVTHASMEVNDELWLFKRICPAVRKEALERIAAPVVTEQVGGAFLAIAYIGEPEDVDAIVNWIERRRGLVSTQERTGFHCAFRALGLMARRGVPGARRALLKMTDPDYWITRDLDWYGPIKQHQANEYESLCFVVTALAIARDAELEPTLNRILEIARKRGNRIDSGRFHHQLLLLDEKYFLEQETKDDPQLWEALEARLRGQTERPTPTSQTALETKLLRIVGAETPEGRELEQEAATAYELFEKAFRDGEFTSVSDRLMDDLKPLPKNPELQRSEKFKVGCGKVQQLCEALKEAKCERVLAKDGIVVETQQTAEGKLLSETVSVTFVVLEGHQVVARVSPDMLPGATLNRDGLLILLRRIDGEWYWNPYGW